MVLDRERLASLDAQPFERPALQTADDIVDMANHCCRVAIVALRLHRCVAGDEQLIEAHLDAVLHVVGELSATGSEELDPVVVPRIVTGRDDCAGNVFLGAPQGDGRSWNHAQVDGPSPRRLHARVQRGREGGARLSGVATDDEAVGTEHLCAGAPEGGHHGGGQYVASVSSDSVSAEAKAHGVSIGRGSPRRQ